MPRYFIRAKAEGSGPHFLKEFNANSGTHAIRLGLKMFSNDIAMQIRRTDKPLQFELVIKEK